jgi:hypothetical protein
MSLLYKGHTVVAGASRGDHGTDFIAVAYIAWSIKPGERGSHCFISAEAYPSFDEATAVAYAEAKAWIDQHVDEID